MPHRTILHAAIALTTFLLVCALGFAFATTQREARLAATGAGAQTSTTTASAAPVDADAIFDKRCSRCHEPSEIVDWRAPIPAADCASSLLAFLGEHGKAPATDNETLSRHLCQTGR